MARPTRLVNPRSNSTFNLENKVGFSLILSLQAVDQVVFQKRIQQQLQKSPRYPGVSINLSLNAELHVDVRAFSCF